MAASISGSASASPISLTLITLSYSQNFDTLASAGTGNAWVNESTLAGWSLFRQPAPGTALAAYDAGTGSSNTGSFYSFGSGGSSERALGGLGSGGAYFGTPASGAVAGWIAAGFSNDTGAALDNFTVGFNGEQWRNGGNATAQTMVLEYGFGATFTGVGSWIAPGGTFNWTSPVATTTAAAVDGNVAGLVASLGGTVSTPWNAGDTLWIRWIENNDSGNDHGLAIDNFSLSAAPTAIPEPASLLLLGTGLVALARRRFTRRT